MISDKILKPPAVSFAALPELSRELHVDQAEPEPGPREPLLQRPPPGVAQPDPGVCPTKPNKRYQILPKILPNVSKFYQTFQNPTKRFKSVTNVSKS
jgi:hypothetical protein